MSATDAPTRAEIEAARTRVYDVARHTPLELSDALSDDAGVPVHLKLECWQPTRSFKVRGAYNAIAQLTPDQRAHGVVTASAGNHGQAVALAARALGTRATVFVPATAPDIKQQRIRRLGAELRSDAADYDEAERIATQHARDTGAIFVHAFSDRAVMAGQGTIGLELYDDMPALRDVVVPVGGGGLITGVGIAVKAVSEGVRVIGVQSTETRAMYEAFHAGRAVDVPIPPTLADGLAGCTDEATYRRARDVVDDIVLVEEADIAHAIRFLWTHAGVVAEGAGAVVVAAVLARRIELRGPAAVVITGGNIDTARLSSLLH